MIENQDEAVRATFQRAVGYYERSQWLEFAGQVDPQALRHFAEYRVTWARMVVGARDQASEPMFSESSALSGLDGVRSLDELIRMDPKEVLAAWLKGRVTEGSNYRRTIVATVRPLTDVAYVVYSVTYMGDQGDEPSIEHPRTVEIEVVQLRRVGDVWRLVLNRDLAVDVVMVRIEDADKPTLSRD